MAPVTRAAPAGPAGAALEWFDLEHAILVEAASDPGAEAPVRTRLLIGPARRRAGDGALVREVVVDGWRVEVELDSERRRQLRERASRTARSDGPARSLEVRAELPGRIARVPVAQGDEVVAGQVLVVIEAMKMHNEVRAPRAGTVVRLAVAGGEAVELGDLLVTLG
ncbi:MAG: acetyl-CoA carboxylase biotin carboxyl carrier protein subunit [Candidatus Limnocylindrales bacterium]